MVGSRVERGVKTWGKRVNGIEMSRNTQIHTSVSPKSIREGGGGRTVLEIEEIEVVREVLIASVKGGGWGGEEETAYTS